MKIIKIGKITIKATERKVFVENFTFKCDNAGQFKEFNKVGQVSEMLDYLKKFSVITYNGREILMDIEGLGDIYVDMIVVDMRTREIHVNPKIANNAKELFQLLSTFNWIFRYNITEKGENGDKEPEITEVIQYKYKFKGNVYSTKEEALKKYYEEKIRDEIEYSGMDVNMDRLFNFLDNNNKLIVKYLTGEQSITNRR